MTENAATLRDRLGPIQRRAWSVGAGGAVLAGVGSIFDAHHFFQSYLFAYVFWVGMALGGLALVMLHYLTGGRWSQAIHSVLEAAMRTLPLMAILFLPLLLGIHHLYEWSHAEAVAADAVLEHKSAYLNTSSFLLRAAVYFAIWLTLCLLLSRPRSTHGGGLDAVGARAKALSAPGLVVYALTVSFASFDWMMSLEPHWFSTIYGLLYITGHLLAVLAFSMLLLVLLGRVSGWVGHATTDTLHDLGKLLFGFVMLWAYVNFSQYLIIWSANLPEETPWVLRRTTGGWRWIALLLVAFHFVVPFCLLLPATMKRHSDWLVRIACLLLFMHAVDTFWLVVPSFHRQGLLAYVLDAVVFLGLGGFWVAWFLRQLVNQSPTSPAAASSETV